MLKNTRTSKSLQEKLNKIQQGITKIVSGDNLKCDVCGRTVKVMEEGKGPLICCGKPMRIF
jgi:desulfoferrodoxin-like iron-binding protein